MKQKLFLNNKMIGLIEFFTATISCISA